MTASVFKKTTKVYICSQELFLTIAHNQIAGEGYHLGKENFKNSYISYPFSGTISGRNNLFMTGHIRGYFWAHLQ